MTQERIINRNPYLYGPGPLARRPKGLGARPPLQGLVVCAARGLAASLVIGFGYKFGMGDPATRAIKEYYEANPPSGK